jgi:peptidoglycan hydrolase CwlO-like protein
MPESVTNKQLLAAFWTIALLAAGGAGTVFTAWANNLEDKLEANQTKIAELEKNLAQVGTSLEYIAKGVDEIQKNQTELRHSINQMNSDGTAALRSHRHD